jgi:hypothetical protein
LKTKAPPAHDVSWAQVHAFRLARHHLTQRVAKKDLATAVGDVGGVQAQVMSLAELQVAARVDGRVEDVRASLWQSKTLVKTWLMRGTLHLVPSKDLPLYSAAMNRYGMRNTNAWLKWMQITEPELTDLIDAIGRTLDGHALTREELIAKVGRGRPERVQLAMRSGWGGVLKPVARRGLLCFGPSRGQSVTFVGPEQWLGGWRDMDPDAALIEVARRYLRAYGPATKSDFTRWWGTWPGVGKTAWAGLERELVSVSVEGHQAEILATDLSALGRQMPVRSALLLPGFDPYVMGHASRDHLVERAYLSRVSRTAGWISPVVLVDGRAEGTWSHEVVKGSLRVTLQPFKRLSPKTLPELRARAQSIAAALGLAGAQLTLG